MRIFIIYRQLFMTAITINIVITTISAAATLAAAFIYYYTLKELKKQRQNTYKPQLFIDTSFFTVQGVKKDDLIMPLSWNDKPIKSQSIVSFYESSISKYALKCYNVGFGTATNVTINFSFNINNLIKEIEALQDNLDNSLKVQIKKNENFISFQCDNKNLPFTNKTINFNNNQNDYISYSLPISINKEAVSINLPNYFLELLNLYVFYFFENKNFEKEIQIPELLIKLNYKDIAGDMYRQKLKLETKLGVISSAGYSGEFLINKL